MGEFLGSGSELIWVVMSIGRSVCLWKKSKCHMPYAIWILEDQSQQRQKVKLFETHITQFRR